MIVCLCVCVSGRVQVLQTIGNETITTTTAAAVFNVDQKNIELTSCKSIKKSARVFGERVRQKEAFYGGR